MARGGLGSSNLAVTGFRLLDTRCFLEITVQPLEGVVDVWPGSRGGG